MRKLLFVALGVVSIGLVQSGAASADTLVVIRPDVETCDTVYVWDSESGTYHALGRPCNYEPPMVVPEESAS
ncbi:MAG TPA: hypothetical protein VHE80_11105 [Acidimicrobiales bacterium]|nr:hypothetical protein [Acidimicrobiales bacterium]